MKVLVLSNPPHEIVDLKAVAPYFGLSPAEVRMKATYPVPEIWFAEDDERLLAPTVEVLEAAGLNTVLVESQMLSAVPAPTNIESFEFSDDGLVVHWDGGEATIGYDAPVIPVYSSSRARDLGPDSGRDSLGDHLTHGLASRRMRRSSVAGLESLLAESLGLTFLDLYLGEGDELARYAIVQDFTDFGGLGESLPRATDNMVMFLAEFADRFKSQEIDRRCDHMRVRDRLQDVTGQKPPGYHNRRSGFSFATVALAKLLDEMSRDLGEASQSDFSSRLVYVARRQAGA